MVTKTTVRQSHAGLVAELAILNAAVIYGGNLLAIDYASEAQMAANTVGLRVIGIAPKEVNNAADGLYTGVENDIYLLANSSTSPLTRANIGQVCYVEDEATVASFTTALVAAGLVVDVDANGVYVDLTPAALAQARATAALVIVAKTDDYTVTAAQAFAGNVVFTVDAGSLKTLTLPTAVAGYKIGVQRISATAAHDVAIQAAAGDKVLGSAAAKKVDNTVDAVSGVLFIRAQDVTDWVKASPFPADYASWVVNDT